MSIRTYTRFKLLLAGGLSKISSWATNIMNITFEFRIFYENFGLIYNRLLTSGLYNSTLMESQSTEITSTKAAPIAYKREFHLSQGRDSTFAFIHRMIFSGIRQSVYIVHLHLRQWLLWRILNNEYLMRIFLIHCLACKWICIIVLYIETLGII